MINKKLLARILEVSEVSTVRLIMDNTVYWTGITSEGNNCDGEINLYELTHKYKAIHSEDAWLTIKDAYISDLELELKSKDEHIATLQNEWSYELEQTLRLKAELKKLTQHNKRIIRSLKEEQKACKDMYGPNHEYADGVKEGINIAIKLLTGKSND
jgi:hypothetical protein